MISFAAVAGKVLRQENNFATLLETINLLWQTKQVMISLQGMAGRMLKGPPLIPWTYISWHYNAFIGQIFKER